MTSVQKKVEKIADAARNSLGDYCMNECKAYCCRKGFLVVTEDQADTVTQGQTKQLISEKKLTPIEGGGLALDFGATGGCPSLKDFKCTIYTDKKRPKACGDFPVFIWKNEVVRLSTKCPAVRENKLYPYMDKIKKLGYKLSYSNEKGEKVNIKDDEIVNNRKKNLNKKV